MTWLERIELKIQRRIPQIMDIENGEDLMIDLIDDALREIVNYENANSYDTAHDNLLVTCVVTLFNYEGMEGSKSRNSNGVADEYGRSYILAEILSSAIDPYLRPIGYVYRSNRYDFPK